VRAGYLRMDRLRPEPLVLLRRPLLELEPEDLLQRRNRVRRNFVDADPPPLRVFFGTAPLGIAESDYEGRLATWREWQPVAELAQGATE